MNHFDLYNIPVTFNPDQNYIKLKFDELSKTYHNAPADQSEEVVPGEMSSKLVQVNEAYRIFKSHDETINYVLQLNRVLVEDENYELPPVFEKEVKEIDEVLTAAKIDNDHERMRWVRSEVRKLGDTIYTPVKNILEKYDSSDITMKELLEVKGYYYMKKYLDRILAGMK